MRALISCPNVPRLFSMDKANREKMMACTKWSRGEKEWEAEQAESHGSLVAANRAALINSGIFGKTWRSHFSLLHTHNQAFVICKGLWLCLSEETGKTETEAFGFSVHMVNCHHQQKMKFIMSSRPARATVEKGRQGWWHANACTKVEAFVMDPTSHNDRSIVRTAWKSRDPWTK